MLNTRSVLLRWLLEVEFLFGYKPAVCGDTLITTVLLVPVFTLHSGIGAAGPYTNVWVFSGSHTWDWGNIHLYLHLEHETRLDVDVTVQGI